MYFIYFKIKYDSVKITFYGEIAILNSFFSTVSSTSLTLTYHTLK